MLQDMYINVPFAITNHINQWTHQLI